MPSLQTREAWPTTRRWLQHYLKYADGLPLYRLEHMLNRLGS